MARIYHVNPSAKNDTDSQIIAARDWLVNHSNGNLTAFGDLETIDSKKSIHLRFKDSDLYIRISRYNSSNTSVSFSVHTRANEAWSNALCTVSDSSIGQSGNAYSLEYAEIDNCLFRIGAFLTTSNSKRSLGIFRFSLHGTDYIGLCGNSELTFINFGSGYTTPYPVIYNTAEHTSYSSIMYSFSNSSSQLLAPSDAIWCPVLSYIKTSDFEQGAIEWAEHAGKSLYFLTTATGSHVFESGANYIVNGVSYKACARDLFVFL